MTAVMIAEKRDQALLVAKAMGWQNKGDHVAGTLNGEEVKLVWAAGHLLTPLEPQEVKDDISWDDPDTLVPIPRVFKNKVSVRKNPPGKKLPQPKDYLARIKKQLSIADYAIIATDPSLEGESIGWQILAHFGFKGDAKRLWLADGLDTQAVKKSMNNLRPGSDYISWHRASEARARSDWSYQFAVRAYTYYARYGAMGRHLGSGRGREGVVSVGRVQTPTLRLVVDRDLEIENFVPQDYFIVNGDFDIKGGSIQGVYKPLITQQLIDQEPAGITWQPSKSPPRDDGSVPLDGPLLTGKVEAESFKARLLAHAEQGYVHSFTKKMKKKSPPNPHDLASIQGELSRVLKITAADAQKVVEQLYQKGYVTYPRTEHSELPVSMYESQERNPVLSHLTRLGDIKTQAMYVKDIHDGQSSSEKPFRPGCFSKKPMEHFGIIPTHNPVNLGNLDSAEKIAYMEIAKRYVQALYPPAQIQEQSLVIHVPCKDVVGLDYSRFTARSEQVVEPGWMSAFGEAKKGGKKIKEVAKGERALVDDIRLDKKRTSPPPRYNDKTLVAAMRNAGRNVTDPKLRRILKDASGIGTPATRSTIIETLLARAYLERKRGALISVRKGRDLIKAVPDWMSSPVTTAIWEKFLTSITELKADAPAVERRDEFVKKQLDALESHIRGMKQEFRGKVGDKPVFSGTSKPTAKMVKYVDFMAKELGLKPPRGYKSKSDVCSTFIEENKPAFDEVMAGRPSIEERKPSDKMLYWARKLVDEKGIAPPDGLFDKFVVCRDFLDKHMSGSKKGGKRTSRKRVSKKRS